MPLSFLRFLIFILLICPGWLCGNARRSVLDDVPRTSTQLPAYREDSVKARLAALPLHEIEGLWEFAGEGSVMAVERDERTSGAATVYRMVAVRSTDLSIRPGTVMGYLTPSSKRGVYDARIYSTHTDDGTSLHRPETCTVTLGDDGSRITVRPYGKGFRVNWWRLLLPYMYRYLITRNDRSPGDIEGCIRIYPAPARPQNPRYL